MIDASQFHDLSFYKSIGNCLTYPFENLLASGLESNNSNLNADEKTADTRRDYSLTEWISKVAQKRKEINNYDKIEKEYYL